MKRLMLAALLCLSLISCKNMDGDLAVHEKITLFKKKSIFSSKLKKVVIPAGEYKATVKPKKDKIKLKISDVDGKSYNFPFKIKEGTQLPSSHGEVLIRGSETGQNYDLAIEVDTDVSSQSSQSSESCVLTYRHERRCHWVPSRTHCRDVGGGQTCRTRPDGRQVCHDRPDRRVCHTTPGHNECRTVSIPVYGSQVVHYQTTTTTKNVIAKLLEEQSIVAKFGHVEVDTDRSRFGSGPCR